VPGAMGHESKQEFSGSQGVGQGIVRRVPWQAILGPKRVEAQLAVCRLVVRAVVMPVVRQCQRIDDAGDEGRPPQLPARRVQEAEVERGVV